MPEFKEMGKVVWENKMIFPIVKKMGSLVYMHIQTREHIK